MGDTPDVSPPRFYFGTKADLRPGDLIESDDSNDAVRQAVTPASVYFTRSLDAAAWEAELAGGDGPGRIYVVEPTGPIEEEPDPARRKFPWPATMYRSAEPLRITGEVTEWLGHAPEALKAMRDALDRLQQR